MKRSGDSNRRTPLVASKPLARKTALNRSPMARSALHAASAARMSQPKRSRGSEVPAKVRAGLKKRSGGMCEVAQPGCTGAATDFSHRIKTGMGGRHGAAAVAHHVVSNALAACRECHSVRLHGHPKDAYLAGWMLREGQDPTAERVLYRGSWRWLDDSGQVLSINPYEATEEAA